MQAGWAGCKRGLSREARWGMGWQGGGAVAVHWAKGSAFSAEAWCRQDGVRMYGVMYRGARTRREHVR